MNTVLLMDIAVGAVLVFSAVVKGAKGLYKYATPLLVTVAAIIGALILARAMTPAVTDIVYPKVEDKVVELVEKNRGEEQNNSSGKDHALGEKVKELLPEPLLNAGEKLEKLEGIFSPFKEKVGEGTSNLLTDQQKDKLQMIGAEAEGTRSAIYAAAFEAAYRLTETVVRWTLRILGFALLYLLFTLLKNALRFTVKLPVIGWVDKIGGAALGVIECAVVLLLAGVLLDLLNISLLHELSEGTKIASFFFG